MYKLAVKESLDKKFKKLKKKDREMLMLIDRKVQEILDDPYRFKPLRKPLQKKRRVHVGRSFVLIYEINEVLLTFKLRTLFINQVCASFDLGFTLAL